MFNVAIDGPGGAGKSSIAKAVSKELGLIYVDTGALYRAVGLNAINNEIDTRDSAAVIASLENIDISLMYKGDLQRVILNGVDVSEDIRLPEASMAASNVSAVPEVRNFLFDLQRKLAAENDCIMDGRDIGTVVLPNAQVKIFLTASAESRAKRRYDELILRGKDVNYDEILKELNERDYQDSHRAVAPLKQADDAILLDTTSMNFYQARIKVKELIEERKTNG